MDMNQGNAAQGNKEADRVRAVTTPKSLQKIDRTIEEKVRFFASQPREVISRRISELDREWDIERILETNASSLALLPSYTQSPASSTTVQVPPLFVQPLALWSSKSSQNAMPLAHVVLPPPPVPLPPPPAPLLLPA